MHSLVCKAGDKKMMESNQGIIWQSSLGSQKVLVTSGLFSGIGRDIVALENGNLYFIVQKEGTYQKVASTKNQIISSLAVGAPVNGVDRLVTGEQGKICLWQVSWKGFDSLSCVEEPGLLFDSIAVGDLDGDGEAEIVAASSENNNVYVYKIVGNGIELLGIRLTPGPIIQVALFDLAKDSPAIAVLYQLQNETGIATYLLTERGFIEGPTLTGLPLQSQVMIAGDFTNESGRELALGGRDGRIKIIEAKDKALHINLTTDVLGANITALAAGMRNYTLAAGTPGGYVFVFSPMETKPHRSIRSGEPIHSLTDLGQGRLAAGSETGWLQVLGWELATNYYTVQPGDTLWLIGQKFGLSVEELMTFNGFNNTKVYPGQVILVHNMY